MRDASARSLRQSLTLAALGAFLLIPANASTPDRSWRGVKRLAVLAEVRPSLQDAALTENFCERVKRVAERGAPVPVECVGYDDPALEAGGTIVLLAQAAVQELDGGRALVFTTRKNREGGLDPQPVRFGAAPRAVALTGTAADDAAIERALGASLAEVLPWLRAAEFDDLSPELKPRKQERFNG